MHAGRCGIVRFQPVRRVDEWLLSFLQAREYRAPPITGLQCGMCRNITPIVDKLATQRNDIKRIDASEKPEIASQFNIMGTPAFVLVNKGIVEKVKLGGMSRKNILKMLET